MKRFFLLCAVLMAMCASVMAVPARRGVRAVAQPNGDSLRVELIGDEHWHAYFTEDGYLLSLSDNGWYYYAKYSKDSYADHFGNLHKRVVATRKKAQDADKRSCCRKRWLKRHIPNRKIDNE